jgi:hypothetical protein
MVDVSNSPVVDSTSNHENDNLNVISKYYIYIY